MARYQFSWTGSFSEPFCSCTARQRLHRLSTRMPRPLCLFDEGIQRRMQWIPLHPSAPTERCGTLQVSLFGATVSLFLLPNGFLNFESPFSKDQASYFGECPQFGDMAWSFVWVQNTILQYLRCIFLFFPPSLFLALQNSCPAHYMLPGDYYLKTQIVIAVSVKKMKGETPRKSCQRMANKTPDRLTVSFLSPTAWSEREGDCYQDLPVNKV